MSRLKVKGQRSRSPGTKKRKNAESFPLTMHSKACAIGGTQQAETDDTTAWPPGGDRLCRWENQHMMSSLKCYFKFDVCNIYMKVCKPVTKCIRLTAYHYFVFH